jgi:hypothetical protein
MGPSGAAMVAATVTLRSCHDARRTIFRIPSSVKGCFEGCVGFAHPTGVPPGGSCSPVACGAVPGARCRVFEREIREGQGGVAPCVCPASSCFHRRPGQNPAHRGGGGADPQDQTRVSAILRRPKTYDDVVYRAHPLAALVVQRAAANRRGSGPGPCAAVPAAYFDGGGLTARRLPEGIGPPTVPPPDGPGGGRPPLRTSPRRDREDGGSVGRGPRMAPPPKPEVSLGPRPRARSSVRPVGWVLRERTLQRFGQAG